MERANGITFLESSEGSTQVLIFSESVAFTSSAPSCHNLFTVLAEKFGSDAYCFLSESGEELTIQYGHHIDRNGGNIPISLNASAFNPSTTGTFLRQTLPKFEINSSNLRNEYQDYIGLVEITNIEKNSRVSMYFEWIYLNGKTGPAIPNGESTNIKYYELEVGDNYQLQITMKDPTNSQFYFTEISSVFEVLESCTTSCDTIQWKFTNDPGECSTNCVNNERNTDTLIYNITGSSKPYIFIAKYLPGSRGGKELAINHDVLGNLHSGECGINVKFIYDLAIVADATASQSSGTPLILEIDFQDNGLASSEYSRSWVEPSGLNLCNDASKTCEIGIGELSCGEIYEFEYIMKMDCLSSVWENVTFTSFTYSGIGASIVTDGALTVINFGQTVVGSGSGVLSCNDFFTSTEHLGIGFICNLDSDKISIQYGHSVTTDSSPLISMKGESLNPCVDVSFNRPDMPSLTLSESNVQEAYADNIATIVATPSYNGIATFIFDWSYVLSPASGPKPDLSSIITNSVSFVFAEMVEGRYQVEVKITQSSPANSNFYYVQTSQIFTVKTSCSADCEKVTWMISTQNPGNCIEDCVTGISNGIYIYIYIYRRHSTIFYLWNY